MSKVISIRIDDEVYKRLVEGGINPPDRLREYIHIMAQQLTAIQSKEKLDGIIRVRVRPSEPGFAAKSVRDDRDAGH